jgi:hypothetical protein
MSNLKKDDRVKVMNWYGKLIEGVVLSLNYRKEPKHYAVNMALPDASKKDGIRKEVWYLPETRFVK